MKARPFYGWVIVFGCFVLLLATVGIVVNTASLFLKPVSDFYHFSRGQFSLYFTITMLTTMLMAPFMGKIFALYNMRRIMVISGLLVSGGFVAYSFCHTLAQFYLASIMVGVAMAGASILPVSIMLTNWFVAKRGLAMAIAFTGSGIGGMIFNPICNFLILHYSFQTTYQVMAAVLFCIVVPVSLFIIKASPAEMGLLPLGVTAEEMTANDPSLQGKTLGEFAKTAPFWLLGFSILLVGLVNSGVQLHVPAYLTDVGYSPTFAANIIALYMGILIFGKLVLGSLIDKFGSRVAVIYCCAVFIIAVTAFIGVKAIWLVYAFALFFGLANAMNTVVAPYVTAEMVGQKSYGVIYGVVNIFFTIGMAAGMPISGAIFDAQGSYQNAWLLYMGLAVILGVMLVTAITMNKNSSPALNTSGK